jgi:hypothetical protein
LAVAAQSLRRGYEGRGGPGRKNHSPSVVVVELEAVQGGAGALGRRELGGSPDDKLLAHLNEVLTCAMIKAMLVMSYTKHRG